MTEARKADRLRIVLLARYREPTMLDLREAECRDLSLGGMFVATTRPSPRGGLIRFECESSAEGESFRGTARVVWQRSKSDPRGAAGMGVRFVHLEPSSREALSRLVARVAQSPSSLAAAGDGAKPAESPATRTSAAVEEQASVVHISNFGSTQHGIGPGAGGTSRSALHAPTLRGVGNDSEAPEVSDGEARGSLDRGAVRVTSGASEQPQHGPAAVGTVGGRLRADPPANLVSNPDRPRNDRPPAAPTVNDEPAWFKPRDRPRSDRPPAPGPVEDAVITPLARTPSDRPLGTTAPGLGAERAERPRNDQPPAPAARTLFETREALGVPPRAESNHPPARNTSPERPVRERKSERPPAPGGVDVLRVQAVVRLPSAAIGDGSAVANGSDSAAVWHGQRASTDPGQPAPRTSWEAPPSASNRRTGRRAAEEAEILDVSPAAPRLAPPRIVVAEDASNVEPVRSWGAVMLWLVGGSGLVVAVVLGKLLGGAPPAIPDSPAATDQTGTFGATPGAQQLALPYRLVVLTDPPGAKVTVGDSTLVAPAEFGLAAVEQPVLVSAALDGRLSTSIEVARAEFSSAGDHYEHEVRLTLPPQAEAPPASIAIEPAPSAPAAPVSPHGNRNGSGAGVPQRGVEPAVRPVIVPFGAPVLPSRTLVGPPGARSSSAPAAGGGTSAVGATGVVTPSDATGALGALTEDAGKRATECLRKGDNACVIRLLEPAAHTAQELEMLIETYRAIGDQGNAERQMKRYVDGFPNGRRALEYNRLLARNPAPAASTAPPVSRAPAASTAPAMSVSPAAPTAAGQQPPAFTPSNPPAAPMPPDNAPAPN